MNKRDLSSGPLQRHGLFREEKKTDETLTKLAQSEVNQHAQAA
jgi:ferritin-like metal-binding protein YciE